MKIFQIVDGVCFYDMSGLYSTLEQAKRCYPADVEIVEAPDEVKEGWSFNGIAFSRPEKDGMIYDDMTGMFYQSGDEPPVAVSVEELDKQALLKKVKSLQEQNTLLEDCIIELAQIIYA